MFTLNHPSAKGRIALSASTMQNLFKQVVSRGLIWPLPTKMDDLLDEDSHDPVNILATKALLVAVLFEAIAGIYHKDPAAICGVWFVDNDNAS